MEAEGYRVPAGVSRTEITVVNSRFITTIGKSTSVDEAKAFLSELRTEMPDASHHVYAFRIGYGKSVIEGMSDDGEPSGTAGPPTLAVLRGTEIGDIVLVTTRYFGGTKLGTGGLVRAYGDAARLALQNLETELKIDKRLLGLDLKYQFFDQVKRLITRYEGRIEDETFAADVAIILRLPAINLPAFTAELSEMTAGSVVPVIFDE